MRDYYEILGVGREADDAGLKSAFRKLAMEHHPDRNGGCEDSSARFKEINEAYSVLSDRQKRAAYDRFGHAGVNGGQGAGFADVHDVFNEVFGDVFGEMFGRGGQRRQQGPARGADLRYDLEISLEQAYAGAEVEIAVPAALTCDACEGSGCAPGSSPTTCVGCNGAGRVRANQGFFSIERTCPRCGGAGRLVLDPCKGCRGAGQVRRERTLQVRIPAGVDDAARIRLAGEGDGGQRKNVRNGHQQRSAEHRARVGALRIVDLFGDRAGVVPAHVVPQGDGDGAREIGGFDRVPQRADAVTMPCP